MAVETKRSYHDYSQQSERLWWSRARFNAPIIIGNLYVLGTLAKRTDSESLTDNVLCRRLVSTVCLVPVVGREPQDTLIYVRLLDTMR